MKYIVRLFIKSDKIILTYDDQSPTEYINIDDFKLCTCVGF